MPDPNLLDIRDLQFLNALSLHKHFANAASACGVSQPAFSMRIKALEDRLGVAVVRRGNRFRGFTEEGEAILARARPILDEMRALEQDIHSAKGDVTGTLVLGVIPTAAAYAARLAIQLYQVHPGIVARIETASSLEIQSQIEDGTIDAGLTYADHIASDLTRAVPVYEERYLLLAPEKLLKDVQTQMTWAQAAELPLSLLEPKMQNRRILDATFAEVGATPHVIAETSAVSICVSMACEGLAATVVPHVILDTLGPLEGTIALPLVEPELTKSICLISASHGPALRTVEALQGVIAS